MVLPNSTPHLLRPASEIPQLPSDRAQSKSSRVSLQFRHSQIQDRQSRANQQSEIYNAVDGLALTACASGPVESSAPFSCWRPAGLHSAPCSAWTIPPCGCKVETEVRSAFDRMARRLREMALEAGEPATIHAAIDGDTGAVRRLLTSTAAVVSEDAPYDSALTIYGSDGEPVAWAGRPTDLLADRLQGEEAWFAALGASGLRLMYVRPVTENGTRLGTIAVERPGHARAWMPPAGEWAGFRDRTPTPSASGPGSRTSRCSSAMRVSRPPTTPRRSPSRILRATGC